MSCPADEELLTGNADALAHARGCARCQAVLDAGDTLDATVDSQKTLRRDGPADDSVFEGATVGPYAVSRRLGAGAMGVVYAAWDPRLEREVALKVLLASGDLLTEARLLARLNHPNVVTVHEVFSWQDRVVLVMELARGVTLREWLRAARRSRAEVRDVFTQCARGLAAAHAQGIIHRDFKPDNVLVDDTGRARLLDFGLAMPVHDGVGGLAGSPSYMALAQLEGAPADASSDQFSWWASLYEALAGHVPQDASTLRELIQLRRTGGPELASVPRAWRGAIARGLSSEPARRFASMDDAARAIAPSRRAAWAAVAASVITVAGAASWLSAAPAPCAFPDLPVGRWDARAQEPALAAAVASWRAGQTACLALPRDEQVATAACLEQAGHELDLALEALDETPRIDAAIAPRVLRRVLPAERCARKPLPPPVRLEADRASLVASLRAQLRFDALRAADDPAGALAFARTTRAAAEKSASPTARAWAGFNEAAAVSSTGDVAGALAILRGLQGLEGLGPREQAWIALGRWLFECYASAAEHCDAARNQASRLAAEVDEPWLRAFQTEVSAQLEDEVALASVLSAWRAIAGADWETQRALRAALRVALSRDDLETARQLLVVLPGIPHPSSDLRLVALQFELQQALGEGDLARAADRLRELDALDASTPTIERAKLNARLNIFFASGQYAEMLELADGSDEAVLRRDEALLLRLNVARLNGSPRYAELAAQARLLEPHLSADLRQYLQTIRVSRALADGDADALVAMPVEPRTALLRAWQLAMLRGDAAGVRAVFDEARRADEHDPVARLLRLEELFASGDYARVAGEAAAERNRTPTFELAAPLRILEAASRWQLGEREAACRLVTYHLFTVALVPRDLAQLRALLTACPSFGVSQAGGIH